MFRSITKKGFRARIDTEAWHIPFSVRVWKDMRYNKWILEIGFLCCHVMFLIQKREKKHVNCCLSCGFYDADYEACTCAPYESWYACPIENKMRKWKRKLKKYGGIKQ